MTARTTVLAVLSELTDAPLRDEAPLDLDRLGRRLLVMGLQERLGIVLPMDVEFAWQTIGDVVRAVEEMVR